MILTRAKFYSSERFELEDVLAEQAANRTDAKLWTKEFLSQNNYILKGFAVSGVGSTSASISTTDATFIIGGGTSDFSYYIAPAGSAPIVLTGSSFLTSTRNYIELSLSAVDTTPVVRAFWDKTANAGLGAEFNQTVNTMTDLQITPVVLQGGFSGLADRLPVAIVDVNGSGVITLILDERNLFFSLSTPSNASYSFPWNGQNLPGISLTLTSVTGTYVAGEVVTFTGGATAKVVTGGTTNIVVNLPSSTSFASGNTVTGGTSGATGTLSSALGAFTGADKDISNFKQDADAIKTEIKRLKGTLSWPQAQYNSMNGLTAAINSLIIQQTSTAKFVWSGTNLSITDANVSPASTDVLGAVRLLGNSQQIKLARADGTGGTSTIPISNGNVLFIQLPASGNQTYSGNGSGAANYQVAPYATFALSDSNYWLAYCENGRLAIRGQESLIAGESTEIGDDIPASLLANIGLADEVTPAAYSSAQFITQGSSLVAAIGALDAALYAPAYDESIAFATTSPTLEVSSSGATTLAIPRSTTSAFAFKYIPGSNQNLTQVTTYIVGSVSPAPTGTFTFGLYSDSSGVPGSLIAYSSNTVTTSGIVNSYPSVSSANSVTFNFASQALTSGTTYWLVLQLNLSAGTLFLSTSASGGFTGLESAFPSVSGWITGSPVSNVTGTLTALVAPTGAYESLPISSGTSITIPPNSRISGSPQQYYVVGKGKLEVFLNGQKLVKDQANGWSEVGSSGATSDQITVLQNIVNGDYLNFRSIL